MVRPGSSSRRDSLPGYDDQEPAAIGYRRGVGGALVALPAHLQPSSSIERKRKTVRMSESHEYLSLIHI